MKIIFYNSMLLTILITIHDTKMSLNKKAPTLLVIDTNIILQCKWQEIDWASIFESSEIEILITPILIREIDALKSAGKKSRKRARSFASNFLDKFLESHTVTIHKSLQLKYMAINPTADDYTRLQLDKQKNDDIHVATALEIKNKFPNLKVFFVSHDRYPLLIAQDKGLEIHRISDEYLIESEPDEVELENRKLKEEIGTYRNRHPILEIIFEDGSKLLELPKPRPFNELEINVEEEILLLKQSLPLMTLPSVERAEREKHMKNLDVRVVRSMQVAAALKGNISDAEVRKYNSELEKHYGDMEAYYKNKPKIENLKRLRFKVPFYFNNKGTSPSTDNKVHIHVPDGCEVFNDYKIDKLPKPPRPPELPNPWGLLSPFRPMINFDSLNLPHTPSNVGGGKIRKTNSYETDWTIKKIQHETKIHLDDLVFEFNSFDSIRSMKIEFDIISNEIPHKATGNLNIVFK